MNQIRETFEKNEGIFRLAPVFVPRRFSRPGRRLRLHPDDYYALGMHRGGIKERWFSSVIRCMNGPDMQEDEGLSYVSCSNDPHDRFLLRDAVSELGAGLIGNSLMAKYGNWPMYSKFFDYSEPLFFHLHLMEKDAQRIGMLRKPEGYYYPPQYNNYPGSFPHTYFGFDPDVTKDEVRKCLELYLKGDNRITELSRAYRIRLGSGWFTPAGVLHAPGSYLTYEPQWNSDVNSVYENVTSGEVYSYESLAENCPEDKKLDLDYIMDFMDWEKNTDPHYKKTFERPPITAVQDDAHTVKWVMYGNDYIAAKEVTVQPGQAVTLKGNVAYGCILVQGHGRFGPYDAETPTMLRFGQLTADEYFVSEQAAQAGVPIANASAFEPLVILMHFAANDPDIPAKV